MLSSCGSCNHKKRCPLKKHYFIWIANFAKFIQVRLQILDVWDQRVNDRRPSLINRKKGTWFWTAGLTNAIPIQHLVKGFIPNWSSKASAVQGTSSLVYVVAALLENLNNWGYYTSENVVWNQSTTTLSLSSSGTKSILLINTKIEASFEFCLMASKHPSKCSISFCNGAPLS